jgi:dihydrofolate reductase
MVSAVNMPVVGLLAVDKHFGIGKDGSLPWKHNSYDMKFFKLLTQGAKVVMGRATWESLPVKPLPHRDNFVLTSDASGVTGATPLHRDRPLPVDAHSVTFIIGGSKTLHHFRNNIDAYVLSHIDGAYDCDTFLDRGALHGMDNIANHTHEHLNISVHAVLPHVDGIFTNMIEAAFTMATMPAV